MRSGREWRIELFEADDGLAPLWIVQIVIAVDVCERGAVTPGPGDEEAAMG
ncbi:hypothetical protein [Kribbella pittospori]|uniref:hypothetical protein n=1 Tax=Kribbella pittospori TaxID=722689 RepID=UPI0013F4634A|nr:hypothetical protein [Kribbella pittospori]